MDANSRNMGKPAVLEGSRPDRNASSGEAWLAMVPFLVLPFVNILRWILAPRVTLTDLSTIVMSITLAWLLLLLVLLLVAWIKSFPRWCFPAWGLVLVLTLYLQAFRGTIYGHSFQGTWRVWIPLAAVAILGSLAARGLAPVYQLARSVWNDWTLLSFTLYGFFPMLFQLAYDEVRNEEPVYALLMLVLAGGAAFYMRNPRPWPRISYLAAGFLLAWSGAMVHLAIYWNGRQEPGMGAPSTWLEVASWTSLMGAVLLAVLLAPALLKVFHVIGRRVQYR